MEELEKLLDTLFLIKDNSIPWVAFAIASVACLAATFLGRLRKIKDFGFLACIKSFGVSLCIMEATSFVLLWAFGARSLPLSVAMSILAASFLENKYFSFLAHPEEAGTSSTNRSELKELEAKFKKTPNYSILEVLLHYGYIGELHKESAELSNIFEDPSDIAETFKQTPILTDQQLKEATAIMNVIRREGKILTRQEALLIVSRLKDKGGNNDAKDIS